MLTTALIAIPIIGALLIAIAPLSGYWLGSLATLISLVEVAVWITTLGKFDFGSSSLQFAELELPFPLAAGLNVENAQGSFLMRSIELRR